MVLGVLGYKLFVPLLKKESENNNQEDDELLLYLSRKSRKSNRLIKAKCKRTNGGFVVLSGSMIDTIDSSSLPKSIKELRDKCIKNKEIVDT